MFNCIAGTLYCFGEEPTDKFLEVYTNYFPLKEYDDARLHAVYASCFTAYFYSYKPGLNFYFSMPALSPLVYDFIDEFNSKMKNIQYEILQKEKTYFEEFVYLDAISYNLSNKETELSFEKPILTIKISDKYSPIARKNLVYFIHHLIRMFSITEEEYIKLGDKPEEGENLIQFMCKLNNRAKGHRSVSEDDITEEMILAIDDIETVNENFSLDEKSKSGSMVKQTKIISIVNMSEETRKYYKLTPEEKRKIDRKKEEERLAEIKRFNKIQSELAADIIKNGQLIFVKGNEKTRGVYGITTERAIGLVLNPRDFLEGTTFSFGLVKTSEKLPLGRDYTVDVHRFDIVEPTEELNELAKTYFSNSIARYYVTGL